MDTLELRRRHPHSTSTQARGAKHAHSTSSQSDTDDITALQPLTLTSPVAQRSSFPPTLVHSSLACSTRHQTLPTCTSRTRSCYQGLPAYKHLLRSSLATVPAHTNEHLPNVASKTMSWTTSKATLLPFHTRGSSRHSRLNGAIHTYTKPNSCETGQHTLLHTHAVKTRSLWTPAALYPHTLHRPQMIHRNSSLCRRRRLIRTLTSIPLAMPT